MAVASHVTPARLGPSATPAQSVNSAVTNPSLSATAIAITSASPSQSLPSAADDYTGSFSSSPHQFASDSNDSALEAGDYDSGSDSEVEPVTPVSGYRSSQDFTTVHADCHRDLTVSNHPPPPVTPKRAPLLISRSRPAMAAPALRRPDSETGPQTPQSRRLTRPSTDSSFKRTVSSLFRRSNSAMDKDKRLVAGDTPMLSAADTMQSSAASSGRHVGLVRRKKSSRHFSGHKSSNNSTRPPSPLEDKLPTLLSPAVSNSLPSADDFKNKGRATTGLTLRGRAVNFVGATMGRGRPARGLRRASSYDGRNGPLALDAMMQAADEHKTYPPERLPWPLPPDAGCGVKARRMSLSLPDDFTIDVAELQSEFEYQHRILGRHGKHVGKGAASRVTLMSRKGFPGELYAVKEFRGKSHRESQAEYEKKIKSEFSIAKSLHHPNIVETIRLCTNSHRWNHVMEYCSEGDLFGLVQKGHLKGEDKKKDRLCLFKQMVQGIAYLHVNGIAHRDIKLENLLLTKYSKLKITDFGVSEVFSGTHPGLRESGGQCGRNMGAETRLCAPGICGSEPYIAPEVLEKRERYDPRALDVWSSAIVMIYMTFGGAIWSRAEAGNLHYDKLVQGWSRWNREHPGCKANITDTDYPKCLALDVGVNPPALRRLLLEMLNPDPRRRMSMAEVMGNRWMRNVECCQLESYDDVAQTVMIDASKKDYNRGGARKLFCHNHLPSKTPASHLLGKMPGHPGY